MINECSTKIETLTGEIAVDGAELKAATEIRAKEQAASLPEENNSSRLNSLSCTGDERGHVPSWHGR